MLKVEGKIIMQNIPIAITVYPLSKGNSVFPKINRGWAPRYFLRGSRAEVLLLYETTLNQIAC